jgi:hypothetical protein
MSYGLTGYSSRPAVTVDAIQGGARRMAEARGWPRQGCGARAMVCLIPRHIDRSKGYAPLCTDVDTLKLRLHHRILFSRTNRPSN